MPCHHCEAAESHFGSATARADRDRYLQSGPNRTTRALLTGLRRCGAQPTSLLDIGGGVGVIAHELANRRLERAILVEAASAYIEEAQAEAERRGHADRLTCLHGDFVELAEDVPVVDLVTLDRVVCCYPDIETLVPASAAKSRRWYGLSFPRDRWYMRLTTAVLNLLRRVSGNSFRTYVHSESRIDELLARAGFRIAFSDRGLAWHTALYERSGKADAHRETGEAWDVVARAKYDAELQEHVELLRSGRHNLLDPEVELLEGLLAGSDVVHLQCSHGLDALGLLNAGAAAVLGIDISEDMIRQARAKAVAVGAEAAEFVCADVTDVPERFDSTADLVYTGRGSLPWVLDLEAWSESVARLLRPDGHVFIFEGHPLDALWERDAEALELRPDVGYFDDEPSEAYGFPASVVARERGSDRPRMLERQWRPGQVIDALLAPGLELIAFREYPELYWDQFPAWPRELKEKLPHTYAILARKPADGDEGAA